MAKYLTKVKKRSHLHGAVILACSFLLVAGLIILTVILIGRFFSNGVSDSQNDGANSGQIHVPQIPPARQTRFDPEDFAYDGDYMTCLAKPSELGVDVSYYQGDIDWQQVKEAGITFAFIRVGGRGYGEGELYADVCAQKNYEGAKAAGIKVGAYFFSQAINEMEAQEEAWYALDIISTWELDLPLVYDWEYISEDARTGWMEESDKILVTKAFFRVLEGMGVEPMAYVGHWAGEEYMYAVQDYPVWVVKYSDIMDFPYDFQYWQYTCTGSVPGIEGDVDINLYIP